MKCRRCGGIMVFEAFYSQEDVFQGYRCIFCGEIIDPIILKNRLGQGSGRSLRRCGGRKTRPIHGEIPPLP